MPIYQSDTIILDTNVVYYCMGLSSAPADVDMSKLMATIRSSQDVRISSISFVEILTKYKRQAGIIRKICSFLRDNQIRIYSNEYIPLDSKMICIVANIRQSDFDSFFGEVLKRKIEVESRFATSVFFLVLTAATIFECNLDPYHISEPIYAFFSHILKTSNSSLFVPIFNLLYKEAYNTKSPEAKIKNDFYFLLDTFIALIVPLCKHTVQKIEDTDVGDLIDFEQIVHNYNENEWNRLTEDFHKKIRKRSTPMQFVYKSGINYGKSINDKHLEALFSGMKTSIDNVIPLRSMAEYLFSIAHKCISEGGAFLKNDINDALILCSITENDVIVSFDTGVYTHLESFSQQRIEYQNSIDWIDSFRIKQ